MAKEILLNPMKSVGSNDSFLLNNKLILMTDLDETLSMLKNQIIGQKREFLQILGIRTGVQKLIDMLEKYDFKSGSKTHSIFMSKTIANNTIQLDDSICVSNQYDFDAVKELMVDYTEHLAMFYEKKEYCQSRLEEIAIKAANYYRNAEIPFIMYKGKTPVACLFVEHIHNAKAWIYACAVKKSERGKGYFRALFTVAESKLFAHDIKEVGLFCAELDYVSKIYEKLGFETIEELYSCKIKNSGYESSSGASSRRNVGSAMSIANSIFQTILLYSLCEHQNGNADKISVTIEGRLVTIEDNGRGHGIERLIEGKPYMDFVYNQLQWPYDESKDYPVQLHTLGMSLCRALCETMTVNVRKQDKVLSYCFKGDDPDYKVTELISEKDTGNRISFVVKDDSVTLDFAKEHLAKIAKATTGLDIVLNGAKILDYGF
jgi:GNAT superfamily N-acetyltransferase